MKVKAEMPTVSKCEATQCAYNMQQRCHAMAITVGDKESPGCDTFFDAKVHSENVARIAGVGACKMTLCQHNRDLECTADSIQVGISRAKVSCLTFAQKAA